MNKIEQFESDVIKNIIAENSTISENLEKQYQAAKVINREFSGYGFYTNFEITDKKLRLKEIKNMELGNTQAKLDGLKFGAGFILFIKDGLIKSLECYTYDEPWPDNLLNYQLI